MATINEKMTAVANAIRAKTGGTKSLTLDEMAVEIAGISTGVETGDATAVAGDILSGKTAYVKDVKVTGTMPNLSAKTSITFTPTNYTPVIPGDALFKQTNTDNVDRILIRYNGEAGYLQPNTLFGLDSSTFGNATPNQVVKGATFTSASGTNIVGTYEGVELNFKVVGGTTQPTNPVENTIWVNTSTDITSYVFSATQPTGSPGMVWISTGTFSTVAFNALKENSVYIYPMQAYQYISNSWVSKNAQVCQNSIWNDLSQGIIFYAEMKSDRTGGFTTTASAATYGTTTASATKQSDGTYLFKVGNGANQWYGASAVSKNNFDLSKFNTVRITWTVKSNGVSGVYINMGFKKAFAELETEPTTKGTYTTSVDISSLTSDALFFDWGYIYSNGAQANVSWYLNKIELL